MYMKKHVTTRRILRTTALCMAAAGLLTLSSCKDRTTQALLKNGSSGKTLELMLVANRDVYTGNTKALIDSLFTHPQDGLNQPEPIFDLVNIPKSSYESTEMFRKHRNILICDLNPENPNKVYKHTDLVAEPQIVYDFAAKDRTALDSLLKKYYPLVLEDLYATEYRRIKRIYAKDFNADAMNFVRKNFGFDLTVPGEYMIAPPTTKEFTWIRKETKDFSQDVLIYVEPYLNENQFDEGTILRHMDTMLRRHVPGPAAGSYIGSDQRLPFYSRSTQVDGQYAMQVRGVYRCFGDFYGGPFVTYAVLSPDKKNVVLLTAFIYSPRKDKRDLLMQVDGIARTLEFSKQE